MLVIYFLFPFYLPLYVNKDFHFIQRIAPIPLPVRIRRVKWTLTLYWRLHSTRFWQSLSSPAMSAADICQCNHTGLLSRRNIQYEMPRDASAADAQEV